MIYMSLGFIPLKNGVTPGPGFIELVEDPFVVDFSSLGIAEGISGGIRGVVVGIDCL